jgi:hypothetical protein
MYDFTTDPPLERGSTAGTDSVGVLPRHARVPGADSASLANVGVLLERLIVEKASQAAEIQRRLRSGSRTTRR